jgi:hypothetical protein
MTNNLDLWERFADIDPKFTKPITGKPYKGTSPNPQYIIRCLTEMFGPVGVGFGWEVTSEGFTPLGDEVLHWCRIRFWHGEGKGFDAYGQTKALMKTKSGFMSDEDAPKKSLTDAIVKAASQIGVGSNIFLGRWDDQKYVAEVNREYRDEERADKPDALDEMEAFGKECAAAIEAIAALQSAQDLFAYWTKLNANRRDIAADAKVIAAKDKRKAELSEAAA